MATVINLQTGKDGSWFSFFYSKIDSATMDVIYDDPIEDGPRMKIRNPVPFFKERSKNRKTKGEYVLNKKTRAMEKVVSELELTAAEKQAENDDFVDYVIQEVDGFKLDGKEIKGTRDEKIRMMEIPIVSMFVHHCVEILQEQGAQEEKAESENLSVGSSSAKTKLDPK
jgi:hypothetical protein